MSLTYTTTNILCAATDVGMHGLLAIVNRTHVTILCYPLDFSGGSKGGRRRAREGKALPEILSAILLFTSHASHSHIWLAIRQA